MLQAIGAGIGAAIMALIFSRLTPRQRIIAGVWCGALAVLIAGYATFIVL